MATEQDFLDLKTRDDVIALAKAEGMPIKSALKHLRYIEELAILQEQLVHLQNHVHEHGLRVAILFEGRDAAGKGGAIKRFVEHLNPRISRLVALTKPTDVERGQWYFRRYIKELPNAGEMVFFDRSWYNRAVVEPVMGFCDHAQYNRFMAQVPEFEHMLFEDGVKVIKFWFSISKDEQIKRFQGRLNNPLKRWKYSPVDQRGQELWEDYTKYKEMMFAKTHTPFSPWIIVQANDKRRARLESIRYVLSCFDYGQTNNVGVPLLPDPNMVMRYHRKVEQIDI